MGIDLIPRVQRWLPASGLLAALVAIALSVGSALPSLRGEADARPAFDPLLRWHVAGRDWLVVADHRARQWAVYDAVDGRPLCRLDAAPVDENSLAACDRPTGSPAETRGAVAAAQ